MPAYGGEADDPQSGRDVRVCPRNGLAQFCDDAETLDPNQGVTLSVIQFRKFFGALSDECLSKWKDLS
jgi:hypothetical protein